MSEKMNLMTLVILQVGSFSERQHHWDLVINANPWTAPPRPPAPDTLKRKLGSVGPAI